MTLKKPIYLDHHATTPVDPRVFIVMKPFLQEEFGNPSSSTHIYGWRAEEAVTCAREQVAALIGAKDIKEIIWTSGTTESNNLALIGAATANRLRGDHIITSVIEHRSVLDVVHALEAMGFRATYLPVDEYGFVDPQDVKGAITNKTLLVSIMAANNEIGTIQATAEIGKICKESRVLFHVDAAQACGKIPVDVQTMGIDLLSMSAHKVYGPKGVGALWIRSRDPHVRLQSLMYGGGQERGLRPGTLAVPNLVGMGKAFEIAGHVMTHEAIRLKKLRDRLKEEIMKGVPGVILNGHPTKRLPGDLNLSFTGFPADRLIPQLKNLAVSSGSACASETGEPSYVIQAISGDIERAKCSIRFGLGRFNTDEEIDMAIQEVVRTIKSIK